MVSYSVKLKGNFARVQRGNLVSLYLSVIINGAVKMLALNLKWPMDRVDNKAGIILPKNNRDNQYKDYLLIISAEMEKVNEIFVTYRLSKRPLSLELFLKEYNTYNRRKDFITYMEMEIEKRYLNKNIFKNTYRNHLTSLNRLKDYKSEINFWNMDRKFYERYIAFLKNPPISNDISTVWGRIKDIKTYLQFADADGIQINLDYKKISVKAPGGRIIYMETNELNELMKLYSAKTLDETHQKTLRAFLFSCFTSLRVSDVQIADWSWIKNGGVMEFMPWKTRRFKKLVTVPLNRIIYSLIEKQKGFLFDLPTDQEMNRCLKDIAVEAKITKRLTFHVARHTFGTHYYRQTKDVVSLQKIMGHTKMDTTMIYVHINETDKRAGMDKMETFFLDNPAYMRIVS